MNGRAPRPRYDLCGEAHDYPERRAGPLRSILICTHPRSGSTLLGEALYFSGGLGCPLEYIHSGFRPGFEERWGVEGIAATAAEVRRRRTDPGGTLAVKLFWGDLADLADEMAPGDFPCLRKVPAGEVPADRYRALARLLADAFPHPTYVHLERRDRLRHAVSALTVDHSRTWRQIGPGDGSEIKGEVAYDFDRLCGLMAGSIFAHDHWRAFFLANAVAPYPITYEEMVADYRSVIERLLRALGHPGDAPVIRMQRQSTAQSAALMRRFLRDQHAAVRG